MEPTVVQRLANVRVNCVAAGGSHSLALTANGEVYVWGDNTFGQLGFRSAKGLREPRQLLVRSSSFKFSPPPFRS